MEYHPTGAASVTRRHHQGRNVILSEGHFGSLLEAYANHARIWQTDSDGLIDVMMRQGLAALTLHLANRPRDTSVGLTLNLKRPPLNLFLTGEAGERTVTGRAFVDGVRVAESSRLFMQARRPLHEPTQSTIEVEGFKNCWKSSSSTTPGPSSTRPASSNWARMPTSWSWPFRGSMPPGYAPWTRTVPGRCSTTPAPLEDRTFRFECGCNPQKMIAALRSLFEGRPEELFQGESQVEASCPRCGRRWWIQAEGF